MVAIRNKDGSITTDREKIVERCAEFYKELYSSTRERPRIATSNDNTIQEVLSTEVYHAIKQMKSNKAPGADGVIIDIIKKVVMNCIKHSKIIHQLPQYKEDTSKLEQRNNHTTP